MVVMTYERADLLLNLVASIKQFLPGCSLRVMDDGSSSDAQRRLLARLAGECEVIVRQRSLAGGLGGLYESMNDAVVQARNEGREWVLFLQDDLQVVRPAWASVRSLIASATNHSDIVMAGVAFDKWMYPSSRTRCPNCSGSFHRMALFDIGLVNLGRLVEHGLRFGPDEIQANAEAAAVGLRSFVDHSPFVAFVPWPPTYRHSRRTSRLRAVRGREVLDARLATYLDSPDINLDQLDLLLRLGTPTESVLDDGTTRSFAELNVETVAWSALAPFGYGEPWTYLAKNYLRNLLRNDGRPMIRPHFTDRGRHFPHAGRRGE